MCTPRCRTCRRNAADEHLTFFPWTTDRQSAFCTARCYTCDNSRLSCLLIVSNINGSPYSQAVLHFQVLHFRPLQLGPPFSGPASSTPAIWSSIFRSCIFSAPAIMSTTTSCQIQVVADLLLKMATKSTVLAIVDFAADFWQRSTLPPLCTRL